MILAVCNDPGLLEGILLAKKIMQILQIIAPLGVIIVASIDIAKAVTSKNEDSIKQSISLIPKRLLFMVILYFVPLFIDMTMSVADNSFEYSSCFSNATKENIQTIYLNIASEKLANVDEIMSQNTWKSSDARYALDVAKNTILKIDEDEFRNSYDERTRVLMKKINEKEKQEEKENITGPLDLLRSDAYTAPDKSSNPSSTGQIVNDEGGGVLPYYNQCDQPWGSTTYYEGTFCEEACGGTSLSMVIAGLTGDNSNNPTTVANKMHQLGVPATFLSFDAFTNTTFLGSYGIKGTNITTGSNKDATKQIFDEVLTQNKPIIINVINHYLVCDHLKDGQYHVLDPGRREFNGYYPWDSLWNDIIVHYKQKNDTPHYQYFYFEKV